MATKQIDWRIARVPVVIFGVGIAGTWALASSIAPAHVANSIGASGLLCLFHLLAGFLILELSFDRSPTTFLKYVLGGMAVRLVIMLSVLVLLLGSEAVHEMWLLLSLLGWYGVALVFEIIALQRKVSDKQQRG